MKTVLAVVLAVVLFSPAARAQSYPQYYNIADHDKAQAEARARNLPLAWLGGFQNDLKDTDVEQGSEAELTQMALTYLQGQAVVIFFEDSNMGPVPGIVHAQDHIADDGPLEGGASWLAPKIVFTDPEVTRALGRVSRTMLSRTREEALTDALATIANNTSASRPDADSASTSAASAPTSVTVVAPDTNAPDATEPATPPEETSEPAASSGSVETNTAGLDNEDLDISPEERTFWAWMRKDGVYAGFVVMILLVCSMALTRGDPK